MTDFLFQAGLSNACFALALAMVAMVAGAKARRPHLAHLLWLLVFVKLMTPPILSIPILTIPEQHEPTVAINNHSRPGPAVASDLQFSVDEQASASVSARIALAALRYGKEWLPPIWLLGSMVVFGWSMVRVCRFGRLLAAESEVAPQHLQTAAAKIARRLKLNRIPTIYTTSTRLSPLVWWAGGKVRIVIPTTLLEKMDARQWQWILAHELAHVRRRDYLVRWIEWLACVCFWWNPVVWWAQRNLRATEEICCDALVLSSMHPKPQSYANSILTAVESLACPTLRPPAVASEINSGGFLERRFKMIVSNKSNRLSSRRLQMCVLLCAIVVLPLRIASAVDHEAVGKRLRAAVEAGELTSEEARIMLGALRRTAQQGERQRTAGGARRADYEGIKRRIEAAVKEGKMTREEAAEHFEGFRRRMAMAGRGERERGERSITVEEYKRAEAKMRKMVEDGKAKPEDVKRRLIEMRKMMGERGERDGRKRDSKAEYEAAAKKIKGAIAAGKITKEQGKARLEGMKKRMAGQGERSSKRISREDYSRAEGQIHKAIAAGKITKEQGREKLAAIRKQIGEKREAGAKKKSREGEARKDVDWEGIKKKIEGAVKSGKMTREEADAKYKAIKEQMGQRSKGAAKKSTGRQKQAKGQDKKLDYDAIGKKIKAAVKAGKMTKEEAETKWVEIKKKAAAKDKE